MCNRVRKQSPQPWSLREAAQHEGTPSVAAVPTPELPCEENQPVLKIKDNSLYLTTRFIKGPLSK